jgi:ParB-like chromosome segregation protein Spo0J
MVESSNIRSRIKKFKMIRAGDLQRSPWNWKNHPPAQLNALTDALTELGYCDAMLVRELGNDKYELCDGHARTGMADPDQKVPCLILDISEQEAKKLILTLDPLAALAEADKGKLDALLAEVQPAGDALKKMLADLQSTVNEKTLRELAGSGSVIPPEEFPAVDENIPTDHTCPKCGFQFSGGK